MRNPDFIIGPPDRPYLLRWWLIPRNRWFNIYLHKILRSDTDRALHDHPWWNVSIILSGSYWEVVPCPLMRVALREGWMTTAWSFRNSNESILRRAGSIIFRQAVDAHRLEVDGDKPVWSLFITGPKVREWGFHFQRWMPAKKVVSEENPGEWRDDVGVEP